MFHASPFLGGLASQLLSSTEPDMERFASSLATDMMLAYYTARTPLTAQPFPRGITFYQRN